MALLNNGLMEGQKSDEAIVYYLVLDVLQSQTRPGWGTVCSETKEKAFEKSLQTGQRFLLDRVVEC